MRLMFLLLRIPICSGLCGKWDCKSIDFGLRWLESNRPHPPHLSFSYEALHAKTYSIQQTSFETNFLSILAFQKKGERDEIRNGKRAR